MANTLLALKYAFNDLGRQKVRTILGIIGVTISVGLLAIVLFLSDSIAVTFVDYLSVDAGNQDLVVNVRHYNGEPANRSSYFEFQPIIDQVEGVTDDIDNFIPRMEVGSLMNISKSIDTTELTNLRESGLVSGIDFELENSINFGSFITPDENEPLELTELPLYHCAIYYGFNDVIKYSVGENITVRLSMTHGDKWYGYWVNLTIDAIFDYSLKWQDVYRYRNLIVVDVETLVEVFQPADDFSGQCKKLIMTFKNAKDYYDSRDIGGSEIRVKEVAAAIQIAIGLNEWNVRLPKLDILGWSEFITMGITIIFVFVSIIGMLIAGILINGILKTSVEERIREFGIFRTLGSYKTYSLKIVLLQGFLLCNFGTITGIVVAYFGTQYIIVPYATTLIMGGYFESTVMFSGTLTSIIIAYCMGVGVGLVVSISPALKVKRLQLIESIHPYRHEDTLYHLQKKATINYRIITVGLILAGNGGFIYFVLPRLMISMDMTLMSGTFVAILMIFLIGLTLAGLGLMPLVLRFMIFLFKPVSKRIHAVVKIFIFRYQRRNSSTIMMFAMSFSFVMFASTVIQSLSDQAGITTTVRFGSDLVMETTGWAEEDQLLGGGGLFGGGLGGGDDLFGGGGGGFFSLNLVGTSYTIYNYNDMLIYPSQDVEDQIDPSRVMTTDFEELLMGIEGVEKVSSVIASPFHLTQIYAHADTTFEATLGDYAGLSSSSVKLIGIDEEYTSTVDADYIVMTRGSLEYSFNETFHNPTNYTCIISEGLALGQNLELGDKVRITITRGDELEAYQFFIVGTASAMPGFATNFGSSASGGGGLIGGFGGGGDEGVIISQDTYLDLLDIPEPAFLDKIFIKLKEDAISTARIIEEEIDDNWLNNYNYNLFNLERNIERQESLFEIMDVLFTLILMATVIICLFGLLSSSYSAILERKKEIGVIRTLGLKGRDINRMFIIEALIIMLASGSIGVIVGWTTGNLLASTLNLFTDIPYEGLFPVSNFIWLYGLSIIFILVGMTLLLGKMRKKKIVDIYRETM